jgi:Protein of unknown function (DUF3667)
MSSPSSSASSVPKAPHAHRKLPECPNCGTRLGDGPNFCPTCGQPNHDVNVSFGHVIEETLEGVFHFDSKVWLTFRELLFQPGKLTVDFLAGRRARFVPPIRLYIFISFVFFFLLSHKSGDALNFTLNEPTESVSRTASTDTTARPATAQRELNGISSDSSGIVTRIGNSKHAIRLRRRDLNNRPLMLRLSEGDQRVTDSILRAQSIPPDWLNRLALKRIGRSQIATDEDKAHVAVRNISIGMFLLMPLFALLLKLFYRRQRPLYVQHLIFSVHLHSFFFVIFSLVMLLEYVLPTSWRLMPFVVGATWVYWVMALHRFSGQTWKRTLWKSALLFSGYVGVLVLFMVGVLIASLLLF